MDASCKEGADGSVTVYSVWDSETSFLWWEMGGYLGRLVAKLLGDGWLSSGRWVAKLISRLLAKAALWFRTQTSLKNT